MDDQEKKQRLKKITPVIEESIIKMLPKEIPITPSLSSVLNRIVENGRINSDTETIETGIQFLEEAQRDSKTCQLLYKKKVFSHSVYHLQQAVEKAVKSYVLITGFYKANEMKKIAIHQSPLIVIKALTEKTGMKRDAQSRHDQTTLTLILNAERAIGNDENQAALTKMSQTEIRGLLSQIKGFYSITEKIMKDLKQTFSAQGLPPFPDKDIRIVSLPQDLLILSIITFPHWLSTRYPGGKIIPVDYVSTLGIVKELPQIVTQLEIDLGALKSASQQSLN